MYNVFVYGSLLFDELTEKLCGGKIKTQAANLNGFRRFAVKDTDYPAIVRAENSEVEGKLLMNLSKEDLDILSFYEGVEYEINHVQVRTENGNMIPALAFTWIAPLDNLLSSNWNPEQFKQDALEFYLNEIVPETLREYNYNQRKST